MIKKQIRTIEKKIKREHNPQKPRAFVVTVDQEGGVTNGDKKYVNYAEFKKLKKIRADVDRVIVLPDKKPELAPVDISVDNKLKID